MKKPARKATATQPKTASAQRTFHGLRDVLFDEINAVRGPDSNPRRALAVSSLAKQIVNTVRVELNVMKETKTLKEAGGAAQVGMLAIDNQESVPSAVVFAKAR